MRFRKMLFSSAWNIVCSQQHTCRQFSELLHFHPIKKIFSHLQKLEIIYCFCMKLHTDGNQINVAEIKELYLVFILIYKGKISVNVAEVIYNFVILFTNFRWCFFQIYYCNLHFTSGPVFSIDLGELLILSENLKLFKC